MDTKNVIYYTTTTETTKPYQLSHLVGLAKLIDFHPHKALILYYLINNLNITYLRVYDINISSRVK